MVLGVTYKKDVADVRESPALAILEGLEELGAKVSYHDPYIPMLKHEQLSLKSAPLTKGNLKKQDLVILTTEHSNINYASLVRNSRLIYDTRNALVGFKNSNIVRL